jgi:fibronectin type 3 domain-containing protein
VKKFLIAVLLIGLLSATGLAQMISNTLPGHVAVVPHAPMLVQPQVSGPGGHSVVLTWTASSGTGVSDYKIYRSTVQGTGYVYLADTGSGTILTLTDTTVANGATYYYVATAVSPSGESGYSNESQAVIPTPPGPPGNLSNTVK